MNPEKLKIKSVTAQEPQLVKRKKFRFVSIPLRCEDEKITLHLQDQKFKIYRSDYTGEKTYSVGITLEGYLIDFFSKLEDCIRKIAMDLKPAVKELGPYHNYTEMDFKLRRVNLRAKRLSLYAKFYLTDCTFYKLKDNLKKKVNPLDLINQPLEGDIVIDETQIFCGDRYKSITCVVKEALITKREKPTSVFDVYEDADPDSEDEES